MNKTMSKIAQINKEELSAQKVELALIDDFKKTISDFNRSRLNGTDDLFKALKLAQQSIKSLNKAKSDGENSLSQYNKILKAADDIGINIPSQLAKAGEQTEDELKEVEKMLRAAKAMNSAI
jgi:hypothetical protein